MATGAECDPARTLTLILTLPEPGAVCDPARTLTLILTLPEPGAACDLASLASVRAFAASQAGLVPALSAAYPPSPGGPRA